MTFSPLQKRRLHQNILRWYHSAGRDFLWRYTHDPYRVLVSEMMLQQTQADRVIGFYRQWIKQFPTVRSLARATKRDVLLSWSGLGYNSRALRLRQCAAEIVRLYSGKIPSEIDLLIKLPGIGKYTAHAIACFAFEQAVPLVDVNIARIVTRLHRAVRHRSDLDSTEMVWSIASSLLPTSSAYHWNQALMDFGSQICTARNPHCDLCVLQKHCASASSPALRRDAPVVHRKSEPSFGLIPRRIIRGRILKILHTRTISLEKLKSILRKWRIVLSAQNLEEIIHQMEKDGLVEISGNNSLHRISLAR